MSRFSNLFAAGIVIVFLAVLFHYFCRVRKKPDMFVQQQIQVPEGYVYPITPTNNAHTHQLVLAPNFGHLHPPFVTTSNVPYPVNLGVGSSGHLYTISSNHTVAAPVHGHPSRNQFPSNSARANQPEEDLPPPYHVAVASSSYPH